MPGTMAGTTQSPLPGPATYQRISASQSWGDPYQMVAPASASFANSSVLSSGLGGSSALQIQPVGSVATAGGGLFGNGGLFAGGFAPAQSVNGSFAAPGFAAQTTQLNAPIVASPIQGGLFQGGLLGRAFSGARPLFPRFQNRVDSRLYLRAEYLLWDVSGMDTPALVTTSPTGTPREIAGVLGEDGTRVLFGGNELNDGTTGGFLISGGFWLNPQRNVAIESEYFRVNEQDDKFNGSSDGSVILGRPYFDILGAQESAQHIGFPDRVRGRIDLDTSSKLRSFLINGRIALCPTHGASCQQCGVQDRTDLIIGYRNLRLTDSLIANENIVSLLDNAPGSIRLSDQFRTVNQFHGLQLGLVHRANLNRAWLESTMRVAIGNNEQSLRINGNTTFDESGVVDTLPGGLYAQTSNIGAHKRDQFTMIPELGVRLGMRLSNRLHATIGYTVLYYPSVVRAGEQIDTDLNENLLPEPVEPIGAMRPRVLWIENDYVAHGLHFGGELHF